MPVVTIGREFGAGGEAVGRLVAASLGAEFLDRSLMEEAGRRLGLSSDEVETLDEQPGSLLDRLLSRLGAAGIDVAGPSQAAAWVPPFADPAFDPRQAVVDITRQLIKEAAAGGNCVVVGRAAGFVLRDHEGATHVFLRAPEADRVRWAMAFYRLGEEQARRRVRQTDANRAAYVRQIYGHDWSHPSHYDLVLDTARLGHPTAAEAIAAVARARSLS